VSDGWKGSIAGCCEGRSMSQVMDEVKLLCPSTKAENLEGVCLYHFISMIYLFLLFSGPFPGVGCVNFMQGMSS
jgi:hypothetical protein